MGESSSTIANNFVEDSNGDHGNAISVYANSSNITVIGNRVINSAFPLTMESSANVNFYNNMFDGAGTSPILTDWGGMTGVNNIMNNTVVNGGSSHGALEIGTDNGATYVIENNIFDGESSHFTHETRDHNIYTGLNWTQDSSHGWSLGSGESVVTNPASIFNNAAGGDYSLKTGSPAVGTGLNLSSLFTTDFTGASRPSGGEWDMGALEQGSHLSFDTVGIKNNFVAARTPHHSSLLASVASAFSGMWYAILGFFVHLWNSVFK